jgi:hypothetical protein
VCVCVKSGVADLGVECAFVLSCRRCGRERRWRAQRRQQSERLQHCRLGAERDRERERGRESRLSLTSTTPVQLGPQDADAGTQRPRHSVGVESGHDDDAESGGDVGVEAAAFVRAQGRDAGVGEEDACTRVLDDQEDAEDGRRGEAPSPLSSGSQDAQADSNVRTRPRRASLSSCR